MKISVIAFLFPLTLACFGQVELGRDCLTKNSIVFAKIMLDVLGKEAILKMLNENQHLGLVLRVDNDGHVLGVVRSWGKLPLLQQYKIVSKLKWYFNQHVVHVRICYAFEEVGLTYEEQLKLAREGFRKQKNKITDVFFPADLLDLYDRDKQRGYKGSRLDYLLLKVNGLEIPISRNPTKKERKMMELGF